VKLKYACFMQSTFHLIFERFQHHCWCFVKCACKYKFFNCFCKI